MTTLAYRDPETGGIVNLSIAPAPLSHSVHGKLDCVECHNVDYRRYPHPTSATSEKLACVECHETKKDAEERGYPFKTIDAEYARSIHATSDAPEARNFSCHSCHDPHRFSASQVGKAIAAIVHDDNQICLSCHAKTRDTLANRHDWLPNRERHWASVRCIDCHTPVSDAGHAVSHQILKAEDSNRDCVNCHSKEPLLLNRLYQYRSKVGLADHGWINQTVFNQAYIVGMSRSSTIDRLALIVIALTLLGLAAHGFGRYKAYQRARGAGK